MRLAVTGFVSGQAGSVASANALLLRALLERGCEVHFFSKASFVDPRPAVGGQAGFTFTDVDNHLADRTRACLAHVPVAGKFSEIVDASTYNRLLVRRINEENARRKFDLCLWLGDYAYGSIRGVPTVSFAQGPPGTDARSLINRFGEIARLAGIVRAWRWRLLAQYRLSHFGLPTFRHTDEFIIGSHQSGRTLAHLYGIAKDKIHQLPYPIDLAMFQVPDKSAQVPALRCLWLGRIIPRKRLDLFLDGAAMAVGKDVDLAVTIIGGVGFVPGYERMIRSFAHPERLTWIQSLPREQVPSALHDHDVLVQPSEEENFGSSVAEAQACGLPVIVGATNGNADYLSCRDIHLRDYHPETLADAFAELARRKREGSWGSAADSRTCAETHFELGKVTDDLLRILESAVRKGVRSVCEEPPASVA
ncbi:MAG: glycosyltransferase family 4 protein [Terrimicrobiaceae bacterium]